MDIMPLGSQPVSFDNKATPMPLARENASAAPAPQADQTPPVQKSNTSDDSDKTAADKLHDQRRELEEIVKSANKNLGVLSNSLVFNLNRDIDRVVVQLVDVSSKEVIRQYPSEEMVEIYTALKKLNDLLLPKGSAGSMGTDDSASGVLLKTHA